MDNFVITAFAIAALSANIGLMVQSWKVRKFEAELQKLEGRIVIEQGSRIRDIGHVHDALKTQTKINDQVGQGFSVVAVEIERINAERSGSVH